ncbi:MAG: hypothetical protein ACUZ8N_11130 [Candidatus Scalindua sp.]
MIGISLSNFYLAWKIYKEIRGREKRTVSPGDISREIKDSLSKKEVAIRVHLNKAEPHADSSFNVAISAEDIPDYTISIDPNHELKEKLLREYFNDNGEFGYDIKNQPFVTSQLIVVPGKHINVDFQSIFVLGKVRNLDTSKIFPKFQEIPLFDFIINRSFVVLEKRGALKCYECAQLYAQGALWKFCQKLLNVDIYEVGIGLDSNDRIGNQSLVFNYLKHNVCK